MQPVNPALAARCLLESGAEENAGRRARSQADLRRRLGDVAVHVRSRIEAGLLLGRLGDPRFPVETVGGVKVILPPLVEIAGGKATIGSGMVAAAPAAHERRICRATRSRCLRTPSAATR